MWWKLILEVIAGLLILMLSSSFWAILKLPVHFQNLLANTTELKRFLEFLDPNKLAMEAVNIEPVFGTYSKNILMDRYSLFGALRMTKNLCLLGGVVLIVLSYFLGIV